MLEGKGIILGRKLKLASHQRREAIARRAGGEVPPFEAAYSILGKSMSEQMLKQVAAVIAGKRINLTLEEARDLAKRA
jgi:hypothetical protein